MAGKPSRAQLASAVLTDQCVSCARFYLNEFGPILKGPPNVSVTSPFIVAESVIVRDSDMQLDRLVSGWRTSL
jgi:hypothetical protein